MLARWALVAAYAAAAGANQLLWLTFAPITTRTAEHYGVSESAVGWLSQVFPLIYVVLAIPAGIALRRAFRPTLLLGAWLTALGGAVRLGDTYTTALIGQILVAIAQPLLLNAVAGVAGGNAKAVAVGSAGIFAGTALALPLAPALEIPTLLRVDAIVAVSGGHRALRDDSARGRRGRAGVAAALAAAGDRVPRVRRVRRTHDLAAGAARAGRA